MTGACFTALLLSSPLLRAESALYFDGVDDHVTMGDAPGLGLDVFTLECWFRWDGEGSDTASTGSGGLQLFPLAGKGRGESDGSDVDMNFGLGVDSTTGALAADFEDMESGANHPVVGVTDVRDGLWHHGAVTYDGSSWAIYLDGILEVEQDTGGATPRFDSVQHFAVATAMDSDGDPDGAFMGAIDELRLWSLARGQSLIRADINRAVSTGSGLVARWGFDEASGDLAADSVGTAHGTVVGASWAEQAPFDVDLPPDSPVDPWPEDGSVGVDLDPRLAVTVNDPEGGTLQVNFYGRLEEEPRPDFSIVVLPDTQYYCSQRYDGLAEMFIAQTQWIVEQRQALNIVYVMHVGDLVDSGDDDPEQWLVADEAMSLLEDPVTTGLADGIPYGIAVGNHDQSPNGDPLGSTDYYNSYFGAERFQDRAYYGGHLGDDNDDHYHLFTASGMDFIVLELEYDQDGEDDAVLPWAADLLSTYEDRRAIVSAHYVVDESGVLSDQGQRIYDNLGQQDTLFLMHGGHLTAEVWRSDPVGQDGTLYTLMADYQFDGNGGDGWLRVMTFSPRAGEIHVRTYSPWLDQYQTDDDSDFVLPYDMDSTPFQLLGTVEAASGSLASIAWEGLEPNSAYQWYAQASDGANVAASSTWSFTTGEAGVDDSALPRDSAEGDLDELPERPDFSDPGSCGCSSSTAPASALPLSALLLLLLSRARGRARRSPLREAPATARISHHF